MKLELETLPDISGHVGKTFGPSEWVAVDQNLIDDFARVTDDHAWYHVDVERAAREMPDGKTIAHGLLTLSLVPGLATELISVARRGRSLNYGSEKCRFPVPVQVGSRVRLNMKIGEVSHEKGGLLIRRIYTMELEGNTKPAMVCEMLTLAYP